MRHGQSEPVLFRMTNAGEKIDITEMLTLLSSHIRRYESVMPACCEQSLCRGSVPVLLKIV